MGAAIVAAWAGAVAIEFATDSAAHERRPLQQTRLADTSVGWPARPGSGYAAVFR